MAEYYYQPTCARRRSATAPARSGGDVCDNTTMLPLPPLDIVTYQHMTTYTIGLGVGRHAGLRPELPHPDLGHLRQPDERYHNWPDPTPTEGATRVDDLWHAAVNGRGRYFATTNANTLSNALTGALSDASKATGSAAGAATNSLEPVVGQTNNAFIATYTTLEWTGDIRPTRWMRPAA